MAFNPQLYLLGRPDLKVNWDAAHAPGANPQDPIVQYYNQFPTFEAALQADYNNDPTTGEQTQLKAQQGQVVTPGAGNTGTAASVNTAINTINQTPGGTQNPVLRPGEVRNPDGTVSSNSNGTTAGLTGNTQGFASLVSANQPAAVTSTPPPLRSLGATGADGANAGNYNQTQQGGQTGAFNTVNNGQTNTNTSNVQNNAQLTNTNNTSATNTGFNNLTNQNTTNVGTTGGTTANVGAVNQNTTTQALDTLGFGNLLKGQAAGVNATDQNRQAWLQDTMQTGGSGFNSQVDQAVRQSLSGPGHTGSGESASARAAGYAASDVARNNLNQRLQASQQLAGPTGLASLSTAANPYIGTSSNVKGTTANTGTNTGTSTNVGTTQGSATGTGFENLVSAGSQGTIGAQSNVGTGSQTTQENTSGNAAGASTSQAAGQIPTTNTVTSGGSGGCVLCTAGVELGLWRNLRVLRRVIKYKLQTNWEGYHHAAKGYFFVFTPVARFLLARPKACARVQPILRAIVYEELRVSRRRLPWRLRPWLWHWAGHAFCSVVGRFPVPGVVTDTVILNVAKRHNILFAVGGVK